MCVLLFMFPIDCVREDTAAEEAVDSRWRNAVTLVSVAEQSILSDVLIRSGRRFEHWPACEAVASVESRNS